MEQRWQKTPRRDREKVKSAKKANGEPLGDGASATVPDTQGKRVRPEPTTMKERRAADTRAAKAWMKEKQDAVADSDESASPTQKGGRARRSLATKKEQRKEDSRIAKAKRRQEATLAGLVVSSSDDGSDDERDSEKAGYLAWMMV